MKRLQVTLRTLPKAARWIVLTGFLAAMRLPTILNVKADGRAEAVANYFNYVVPIAIFWAADLCVSGQSRRLEKRANRRFILLFFTPLALAICLILVSDGAKQFLGSVPGILIYVALAGLLTVVIGRPWILQIRAEQPTLVLLNKMDVTETAEASQTVAVTTTASDEPQTNLLLRL